jgi:sporulation protein YlmC with PRC-barrel domain
VIRASDLIGCVVRTEAGEKLGRVHDLRAHSASSDGGGWKLVGLVVGRGGLRARFGAGGDEAVRTAGNVIPWEAVTRLSEGLVVVRDVLADAPGA